MNTSDQPDATDATEVLDPIEPSETAEAPAAAEAAEAAERTESVEEILPASGATDSDGDSDSEDTTTAPTRRVPVKALALGIAAVLALGGAGAAVAAAHKTVAIDVDGETTNVSTFAGDVGDLLAAQGITPGEHDLVVPAVDEALTEQTEIVVRSAEQIEVTVDGQPVQLWTVGDTAAAALADIAASGREALLTASRTSGRVALDLPLVADGPVIFVVDGEERTLDIGGVADLSTALLRAEIDVDEDDRVSVTIDASGTPVVTVTRIATEQDTRTESIDFETVERGTDDLYEGEERVVAEGAEGERTFTYVQYVVDGEVVSSRLVRTEVTTEPQDRVIEYGTAVRPAPEPEPAPAPADTGSEDSSDGSGSGSGGGGAVSGDVWAALAQCESGGNPTTNTGNGYYGMYQFSLPTWQSVGGTGLPSEASAAEQTQRAQILQARAGWGQWPHCAAKLGLL